MGTYSLKCTASPTAARRTILKLTLLAGMLSLAAMQPAAAGFHYVGPQTTAPEPMASTAPSAMLPQQQAGMQAGTVQGFANQVPLPVALRQILPRGTAFRINDDVSTATLVSWKGGRPWQQTLDDMLAGAGLQASYTQNGVMVQRGAVVMGEAPTTYAPVAAMPMAAPVPTTAPVTLMPTETGGNAGGFAAPAYAASNSMQPLEVPAASPAFEPAPQPYIAPASTGVANMVPDSNGTLGSIQAPVQNTVGALPEGTVGELPQQAIPGTSVNDTPDMQTSALNPLNPGPSEAQTSLAGTAAQTWEAHSGQSLHEVLVAWAERAGVELNWVAEYDYPIQASISFNGSFEEATRTLLGGFVNASPQPIGRLHRNEQLGQQALVIETRGNQYDE